MKTLANIWKNPWHFIAFGFGAGCLPKAPGTWGTLVAIPFYIVLSWLPPLQYALVVMLAFCFGVWLCGVVEHDIGTRDHSGIVWDEMVGLWITLLLAPVDWCWILAGFVLFRFFDIVKPWPIRWVERSFNSGVAIMLDDAVAALYAWAVMRVVVFIIL